MSPCALLTLLLVVASPEWQEESAPDPALGGLDPVELCEGRETVGLEAVRERHGGFLYHFASLENRERFRSDPDRWGIQWGGSCARMGPLSGGGDPARFHVHRGRIYVFASDACREGFRKAPDRFLEPDDIPPASTVKSRARGADLIAKAVAAIGGAQRLAHLQTLRCRRERKCKDESGREMMVIEDTLLRLPDSLRRVHAVDSWSAATVVNGTSAFRILDEGEVEDLSSAGARELRRKVFRDLPLILRGHAQEGWEATALGPGEVGDERVERVAVSRSGMTTVLGIEPGSGRILSTGWRGRGPQAWFGDLELTWSDFRPVNGLQLPHACKLRFEGSPEPEGSADRITWTVDEQVGPELFERPGS